LPAFSRMARSATLPILALCGIDAQRVRAVILGGAAGIAVIRAVFGRVDPAAAVAELLAEVDRSRAQASAKPPR